MIYPGNFEEKIGFDKIRELLHKKCLSSLGQEKVSLCHFNDDFETVDILLNQTKELMDIVKNGDEFPFGYMLDTRSCLELVRLEGRWLDADTLFDLKRSLQTVKDLVAFFCKEKDEKTLYPFMRQMSSEIQTFPYLIKSIDKIIDVSGQVKDSASAKLSAIRREKNNVSTNISKTINSILRHAQKEGWIDKDVNPSFRDGRLVIPIPPMNKKRIKGIVHDESATGKTVYVEPVQIVEANNKIRELENDEKREIIKILTIITNDIRPYIDDIIISYNFLGEIDFLRAKAMFSEEIGAIVPVLENRQIIDWVSAKHPLLYLSLNKQNKKIIPLDITLNSENCILLISGPNAGGKSVCLKTVGLLQYMLQCGLPIPISEVSITGIFQNIFIDIGDEQSIEDDLSTYSSHLTNMKFFDKYANDKTLLLIDEFGSGTEPQIGGAIAEALLKKFNDKKIFGVVTTHYQNLKQFANTHDGIINGAMLYDRHLMQPLYTLSIGNPGSSFAIEIARKIGLHEEVIEYATNIVGTDYVNMDKYLQDIVRDKRYWETKRQNIRKREKQLEEKINFYEENIDNIEKEKKKIINDAKLKSEKLLSDANAKIENTIRQIREIQADKEKTKQIRESFDNFKQIVGNFAIENNKGKDPVALPNKKKKNKGKERPINPTLSNEITVGDMVRIVNQKTIGEVLEIIKDSAIIAIGAMRSNVKLKALEKISNNKIKKEQRPSLLTSQLNDEMHEKKLNFKLDLDIRGFRAEEALQAVMYYIDDAILVGMPRVRILHGTGTGALRSVIRDYLKTHTCVRHFADEHVDFGGAGITVVDL